MTLDLLDRAFIDRWNTLPPAVSPARPDPVIRPAPAPPMAADDRAGPAAGPAAGDLVDRLLQVARTEWSTLADVVESARRHGRRAIAIIGCEPGAGCTTIVDGLVRMLRGRGHDTVACDGADMHTTGPTHDTRIVLVDAGVWFPPGRIHRQRLVVASTGCDAAILVRKGNRPAPSAWSVALEAIGVEPLGEVVSFAPPADAGGTAPGDTR